MKTHEVNIMKTLEPRSSKGPVGRIAAAILLMLAFGVAPPLAHAVSGNATIFNEATVTYTSGAATLTASDDVTVLVTTLATAPDFGLDTTTNPAAQTVDAGADATYDYTLTSNANGTDTYNLSLASVDNAFVSASTDAGVPATMTLWGGIVVDVPANNTIDLPGGSISGDLTAGVSVVVLDIGGTDETYTVATVTPGNAQTTVPTDEVYDRITLTPIGASPAVTNINVLAGDQIGEQGTFTLTQTAGTPNTPGTDGTHTNTITSITTAVTVTGGAVTVTNNDGGLTVTTVNSPAVTILKESRNVTAAGAFAAAGTTAKPGEVIEYRITVTGDPGASITNVFLTDVIPDYTAILTGAYGGNDVQVDFTDVATAGALDYSTTFTVANDGDEAETAAGSLTVTFGIGAGDADPGASVGGTLNAADFAEVYFRVTVL